MHLLFTKLTSENTSIAIKTDVKLLSLLPGILGPSTTTTRPMQIYMDIGVSLLRFRYPATLKNYLGVNLNLLYM